MPGMLQEQHCHLETTKESVRVETLDEWISGVQEVRIFTMQLIFHTHMWQQNDKRKF